ncbi:MAG: hypothetical protein JWO67_2805 [Streptosporangiaceae bacterium]|jgi:hypothetical protein|nr:hypothetical protein [Streptosporangiaceae bacterium]
MGGTMRRLFWLGLGAGLGAWGTHRLTRFARGWTPRGLGARALGLGDRLRAYADDIRTESRVREAELRDVLGLDAGVPQPRDEWLGGRPGAARTVNGQVIDEGKDGH